MENSDKITAVSFLRRFLQHSAPLGLFVVLPLIIAGFLGHQTLANERAKHIESVSSELEKNVVRAQYELDAATFLRKIGRGAWSQLRKHQADAAAFTRYCQSLQRFMPIEFDLYAFDPRGNLVTPASMPMRSRYIANRLWELTRSSPIEQSRMYLRMKKQLKAFVGEEFRVAQFLEGRDSCLPVIARHQHGMIYWINDRKNPAHGILMVFWDIPSIDFRLKEVGRRNLGDLDAVIFARSEEEALFYGRENVGSEKAAELFRQMAYLGHNSVFDQSETLWTGRKVEGLWLIAAARTLASRFDKAQLQMHLALFVLALLVIAAYFWAIGRDSFYLSLRIKLIALFFMAVMMPIMGFAYLGYRYLDDREQTLQATVANHSRQLLFGLDESFKNAGQSFFDDFSSLSRRLAEQNNASLSADIVAKIESNDLISIELRDARKAEMLFFQQNELFFEGMREVSDAFSRFCIDNTLGTSLTDAIDPILDMVVRSPEAGMNFFFVRPKEVHKMDFGPTPMFIYWEIFNAEGLRPLYTYIVQSVSRLMRRLVDQRMREARANNAAAPYMLAASSNKTREWLPTRIVAAEKLKDFVNQTQFSDKPVDLITTLGSEKYLITGLHGRFAGEYCLFAFYPLRLVAQDIARQARLIRGAILLFLLLAMTAAWFLSDVFLLPIARLGEGVNAIKGRNSDFRIVSSQKDEFGDLAVNFNQMIADLKEMQLAKDVQESLLPSEPPPLPGYQISFTNRMASAVGGDYFDVRVLQRDRVCIIIGDVTGHGVGSALVMAMAKAVVYQGLKEDRGLIEIFEDLNHTIYTYFHLPPVRKMITVFAAMIELPTGRGSFVNAGHNFPVQVVGNKTCVDLAAVHLPIGAVGRLRGMQLHEFTIAPDDYLVFYTDGLIEVVNSQKEMYSYDRFKDFLVSLSTADASQIAQSLVEEYDKWLGNNEPDDDLTIVVLKRLKADA